MASQQRPAWFRLSNIMRPPAPLVPDTTPRASQASRPPAPPIPRPSSIPFRPPTQTQEPVVLIQLPPPADASASSLRAVVPPPPEPAAPPPRFPVAAALPAPPARFSVPTPPASTPIILSPVPTPVPTATTPQRSTPPQSPSSVAPPRSPIPPTPAVVPTPQRSPVVTSIAPPRSVPQSLAPPRSPISLAAPPPTPVTTMLQPNGTTAPASSLPTSPPARTITLAPILSSVVPNYSPTPPNRVVSPAAFPSINTPDLQSPKIKPPLSPSPLTLPPAQIKNDDEEEQKTVLVQETINKPMKVITDHDNIAKGNYSYGKKEPTKHSNNKDTVNNKKKQLISADNSQDWGMRVITLAGENKGAVMELSPLHNNNNNNNKKINGNPHTGLIYSISSSVINDEAAGSKSKNNNSTPVPMSSAYLNSNVQGVNNSILFNFTCKHKNPGVHLSLTRKPNADHHKDSIIN